MRKGIVRRPRSCSFASLVTASRRLVVYHAAFFVCARIRSVQQLSYICTARRYMHNGANGDVECMITLPVFQVKEEL